MSTAAPASVPSAPLPAIEIRLMGGWHVLIQGTPGDIPAGQPRALLAYLLLQPNHAALRTTLVEEIWPDIPAERGRRYLTDALYRLRRALEPAAPILADATQIRLDMSLAWRVDVWDFYAGCASPDPAVRAATLDQFQPELAPEIADHWILVQRVRLQERFVETALEVAAAAEAAQDLARAETLYRQTLTVDPLLEPGYRGLMRSLARRGQLVAALEQYDVLVDRLEREVSAPPSPETRTLADQLFQELDLARQRAQAPTPPRLVGRADERTRLLTALDRARAGMPGLVVLLGEPGIGKTALLRDLARAADWRGWQIHWGIGQEDVTPAPYAPLTEALHAALPEPRAAQLAAMLPPVWYDLLARLFPTLRRAQTLPAAALEAQRLPQALAALLGALQEIAPLLLLLDNVQAGGPALWPLLAQLLPLLHHQRTLIVLSARDDTLRADETVWSQLEQWDRDGAAQVLALEGLTPAAVAELAQLHAEQLPDRARLRALHTATGGNPLLTLEILATGTPDALLTGRPAIATLLTRRLHQLSAAARQAVELAAVLGSQVRYPHWEALWHAEHPYQGDLAPEAAELERAGVIQITAQGYAFAHDTLHAAALALVDPHARRRRHKTVLRILTAPNGETPDLLRLLYHAQCAGDARATAEYAHQAGDQALAAFAFGRADTHYSLALDQLTELAADPSSPLAADQIQHRRIAALLGRVQARHVLAAREGERADLDELARLPLAPADEVQAAVYRAEYHLAVGELDAAQAAVDHALTQSDALDAVQVAAIYLIAARISRDQRELDTAEAQVSTAQHIYQQSGDRWGVAMTTDLLGGLAWDQGSYEQSAVWHAEAARAFGELGDLVREAQSLNNLGSAYWELGRYGDARATHERSIVVCRELGNKLGEGDNIDNLGGVAWVLGDYALAIRQYRAAIELRESIGDLWGVAISLSNLGSAYRQQGAYAQALDYYQRSLPLCRQVARKRNEAYVLHGEGETWLAMGRPDEAWERLQQAHAMRVEIGDRVRTLETLAALVHTAVARDDFPAAAELASAMLAQLAPEDKAPLRQEVYFAAFHLAEAQSRPADAVRALAQAVQAQDEMAAALPPVDRRRFLENVPLNRQVTAAAQRYTRTATVALSAGKAQRTLTWTLDEPGDHLIDDPTARRRHILMRLLAEAARQDAAPTHDQLAAALAVSRRTILRDLAALGRETEDGSVLPSTT